jgi:hypothetical protein
MNRNIERTIPRFTAATESRIILLYLEGERTFASRPPSSQEALASASAADDEHLDAVGTDALHFAAGRDFDLTACRFLIRHDRLLSLQPGIGLYRQKRVCQLITSDTPNI